MADKVGEIYFDLDAKTDKFHSALSRADKDAHGFGNRMGQMWDSAKAGSFALLGGLTAVGIGAGIMGAKAVKAFNESEQATAQLEAVLKSTGGVAGVTKDEVIKLSDALMMETGVSDEAVTGAQAMLLTFTNIGKDIFPDVTKTTLDMATAMNGGAIPSAEDLRNQAIQLGKALQDPDKGLGALKRVGVNVDELSKKFNDSMSIQEKQKLILQELQTEFGGSAKMAGQTFAGQLNILKETFGNVMEAIGGFLVDAIAPLVDGFNKWFKEAGGVEGVMKKLGEGMNQLRPLIAPIATAIMFGLIPAIVAMGVALLTNPITWFVAVGFMLGLMIQKVVEHFGGWHKVLTILQPYLQQIWDWVQNKLIPAISSLWQWFNNNIIPVLKFLWGIFVTYILPVLGLLWAGIVKVVGMLVDFYNKNKDWLIPVLKILAVVVGVIVLGAILGFIGIMIAVVGAVMAVVWVLGKVVDGYRFLVDMTRWSANAIVNYFHWWVNTAINTGQGILNWFQGLPGRILGAVGNLGGLLYNAGRDLIQGLINGLMSLGGEVGKRIRGIASGAVNDAKSILGIKSPSTVFAGIGENIGQGLIQGLTDAKSGIDTAMDNALKIPDINSIGANVKIEGVGSSVNKTTNTTNLYGNITLGNKEAVDEFFKKLSRNNELARKGLATI